MRRRRALLLLATTLATIVGIWGAIRILERAEEPGSRAALASDAFEVPMAPGSPTQSGPASTLARPRPFEEPPEASHGAAVSVRVTDAFHRPVPDAPVAILCGSATSGPEAPPPARGTTDRGGMLTLTLPGGATGPGAVVLEIPGPAGPTLEIDLDHPPRETLVLSVPASGRLRVRVLDGRGAPFPVPGILRVTSGEDHRTWALWRRRAANSFRIEGEKLVEHVPLGVYLHAEVILDGSRVNRADRRLGPRAPGEEVGIDLSVGDLPWIAGRALDHPGHPLARTPLSIEIIEGEPSAEDRLITTAPDGRFRCEVLADGKATARALIRDPSTQASATVEFPLAGPAIQEIGDVVLRVPPLLVKGVVVDRAGNPIGGAGVSADYEGESARMCLATQTDAAGRFDVRGVMPAPASVSAHKDGYHANSVELPATLATDPVRIALERCAAIEGRVILGEGWHRAGVRIQTTAGSLESFEDDGSFRIGGLAAGEVQVGFYLSDQAMSGFDHSNAAVARTVAVASEATVRLDPIDLRGKALPVAVRVVDAAGHPVSEYRVTIQGRSPIEQAGQGITRLLLSRACDLAVSAPGKRTAHLPRVTEDVTAVLLDPYEILVRLTGIPSRLPPDVDLVVSAESDPSRTGSFPRPPPPIEIDGTARLVLPVDGTWTVFPSLRRIGMRTAHYKFVGPRRTVQVGDESPIIEIRVDPDGFARALEMIMSEE